MTHLKRKTQAVLISLMLTATLVLSGAGLVASQAASTTGPGSSDANAIAINPSSGWFNGYVPAQGSEWFVLGYTGGSNQLTINLTYEPADNTNFNVLVFTGDASSLHQESTTVTRSGNTLSVPYSDPNSRRVSLEVVNTSTTEDASFTGQVTPTTALTTAAGQAEPVNGAAATPQGALTIPTSGTFLGTLAAGQTVWYAFYDATANAQASITVTLSSTSPAVEFDLHSGPGVGNLAVQTAAPTVNGNTITRTITPPQAEFIYLSLTDHDSTIPVAFIGTAAPVSAPPAPAAPTPAPPAPTPTVSTTAPVPLGTGPFTVPNAGPVGCAEGETPAFSEGFGTLASSIGSAMGTPTSCPYPDPSGTGDTEQTTTSGLAYWRKSTNTPTFTDGWDHWAWTTSGLLTWQGGSVDPPNGANGL